MKKAGKKTYKRYFQIALFLSHGLYNPKLINTLIDLNSSLSTPSCCPQVHFAYYKLLVAILTIISKCKQNSN